jgi:hypothetical protein
MAIQRPDRDEIKRIAGANHVVIPVMTSSGMRRAPAGGTCAMDLLFVDR